MFIAEPPSLLFADVESEAAPRRAVGMLAPVIDVDGIYRTLKFFGHLVQIALGALPERMLQRLGKAFERFQREDIPGR